MDPVKIIHYVIDPFDFSAYHIYLNLPPGQRIIVNIIITDTNLKKCLFVTFFKV